MIFHRVVPFLLTSFVSSSVFNELNAEPQTAAEEHFEGIPFTGQEITALWITNPDDLPPAPLEILAELFAKRYNVTPQEADQALVTESKISPEPSGQAGISAFIASAGCFDDCEDAPILAAEKSSAVPTAIDDITI